VKDIIRNLLDLNGHHDWNYRIINSGGGLCVHSKKQIWIDEEFRHDPAFILHEIAHIRHRGHDSLWGDHYTRMMTSYVRSLEDAIQQTLDENRNLADGEDCTLRHLVRVLKA
jgi:hypothetical protein